MERHQAGQEEALVEVQVEKDCLEVAHRPRGSPAGRHGCFSCVIALATVMGLVIVALVAGFMLHLFMFTTASRNQDSSLLSAKAKFNITCEQTGSDEHGRYDIVTVNKSADYIIYGEVKDANAEEVNLIQTWKNDNMSIKPESKREGVFIFLDKVRLNIGTRISIEFDSTFPDSCRFLFFEL